MNEHPLVGRALRGLRALTTLLLVSSLSAAQGSDWDVLVLNIDWGDGGLFDEVELEAAFDAVGAYWSANSYGAVTLDPDVVTIGMPNPKHYYTGGAGSCSKLLGEAMADALAMAAAAGKDPASYDFHALMNDIVLSSSGAAGGKVWMGTAQPRVIAHELTHSLDVKHSNAYDTRSPYCILPGCLSPLCSKLVVVEYGNIYDVIGLSGMFALNAHLNPRVKHKLGWLSDAQVEDVCQTGQYTIQAHDKPLVGGLSAALRIPINSDTNYWIEYRQNILDPGSNVDEGVLVLRADNNWGYWNSPGFQQSLLIDMHRNSVPGPSWELEALDAALELGEIACLPGGVSVEVLALAPSATPPTATVEITKPNQCPAGVDQPSAIAIQSPANSTTTFGAGPITFLVAAHDPDLGTQNGDGIERVDFHVMDVCNNNEVPVLSFSDAHEPYEWVLDAATVNTLTTRGYVLVVRTFSEPAAGGHHNSAGTFFMVDLGP